MEQLGFDDLHSGFSPAKSFRSRNFHLVLYPDDVTHMSALSIIRDKYRYCLILHDKDVKDNGDPVKPHYHVLVKFPQARWNTAFCNELGLEERWAMQCRDFNHDLRYLVHADHLNKFQYPKEAVEGNLLVYFNKALKDNVEEEDALDIQSLIDSCEFYITKTVFFRIVCQNGLYAIYRRSYGIFKDLIMEHNLKFTSPFSEDDEE